MPTRFNTINRPKRLPEASRRAGLQPIAGVNKLEVRNEADEDHIYLAGSVGSSWWDEEGITEKEVRDALKSVAPGRRIRVHINSEGGSVKEGLGIYNAFKQRRDSITAEVNGYALSIASVFPLAAGRVVSPRSAIWMIHKAWSWAAGNSEDMEDARKMLEEHDEMLAEIYSAETERPIEEMRQAMKEETWVRGSQAVEFGLADETDSDEEEDSQASYAQLPSAWLDRCKNISPHILNALKPCGGGTEAASKSGELKPNKTMNRDKVLALLKKHGITVEDSATDEQLEAALNKLAERKPEPAANPAAGIDPEEIKTIRAALKETNDALARERRNRITLRLDNLVVESKLTKDERDEEVALCLADETRIDRVLAKRQPQLDGVPALSGTIIVGAESPMEEIGKLPTAAARFARMKNDWESLYRDAIVRDARGDKFRGARRYADPAANRYGLPVAVNTYSATLITDFLIDGSITPLQNRWAALRAFSREFSTDTYKPTATGQVKYVSAASAAQTNPTNFETGDSTVDAKSISVDQISKSFHVTNNELNSGLRMENLIDINLGVFSDAVITVATADITEANFANYAGGSYIAAPAAFGWSDMALLWGALKKANQKHAVLDGEYVGMLLNSPTFFQQGLNGQSGENATRFGWDGIWTNTNWTGAGAGVRGFVCHPQAIGVIAGLPLEPPQGVPGNTLTQSVFTVPEIGISVAVHTWFSLASRTSWMSYDVMFGAEEIDTTAGIIIKAA